MMSPLRTRSPSGGGGVAGVFRGSGAPDRIRTCDLRLRRPTLYPLSYRRLPSCGSAIIGRGHGTRAARHRHSSEVKQSSRGVAMRSLQDRRRPPPKRGPSLLPDSLIARASFTHGFPHYPNPNLPMALQSVVNRCANSPVRIDQLFPLDKGFGGLDSFTKQSGLEGEPARSARSGPHQTAARCQSWAACAPAAAAPRSAPGSRRPTAFSPARQQRKWPGAAVERRRGDSIHIF